MRTAQKRVYDFQPSGHEPNLHYVSRLRIEEAFQKYLAKDTVLWTMDPVAGRVTKETSARAMVKYMLQVRDSGTSTITSFSWGGDDIIELRCNLLYMELQICILEVLLGVLTGCD